MTAHNSNTTTMQDSQQKDNGQLVEECASVLVLTVQKLRNENNISEDEEVSLYVTDAPIVHSTLSEYREDIMQKANLVDIVQVNIKAGTPMPAMIPQIECTIGDDEVTIGIDQQADE